MIQVVELLVSRSDETSSSTAELESTMEQLTSHSVCYVTSASLCAVVQRSGVNAKFWTSLEQRALDVLEKVFCFDTTSLFLVFSSFTIYDRLQPICEAPPTLGQKR